MLFFYSYSLAQNLCFWPFPSCHSSWGFSIFLFFKYIDLFLVFLALPWPFPPSPSLRWNQFFPLFFPQQGPTHPLSSSTASSAFFPTFHIPETLLIIYPESTWQLHLDGSWCPQLVWLFHSGLWKATSLYLLFLITVACGQGTHSATCTRPSPKPLPNSPWSEVLQGSWFIPQFLFLILVICSRLVAVTYRRGWRSV